MPGRRKATDHALERALEAIARALTDAAAPWMVIGGIAVIMRGVRRMTTDIDVVVGGGNIPVAALAARLARHALRPRIDDAIRFAQDNLVLLVTHQPTGVDVDVSFGWTRFEQEALAACGPGRYGEVQVPTARADDLMIYKALAGRPQDLQDVSTLLALYPDADLVRVRRRIAELTEVADKPELLDGFDRLVATARKATPRRPRAPRRSKPRAPQAARTRAPSPSSRKKR